MDEGSVPPINLSDDDAPFSGPDPDADEEVSMRPKTDGDIDAHEYYDEGLEEAAELGDDPLSGTEEPNLPDGYHVE